jgi:hypothetical protein
MPAECARLNYPDRCHAPRQRHERLVTGGQDASASRSEPLSPSGFGRAHEYEHASLVFHELLRHHAQGVGGR